MINGIDYQKFENEFLQTDVGKRIKKDFDHVTCVASNIPSIIFMKNKFNTTCTKYFKNKYGVRIIHTNMLVL
jgi:hypothetical protein